MPSLQTLARRALPLLMALGAAAVTWPAQAGGVQWSVGIQVPMPGVIVYPAPPQVVHVPVPVQVQPRRVYVQPPPLYSRGHYAQEPEVVYLSPRSTDTSAGTTIARNGARTTTATTTDTTAATGAETQPAVSRQVNASNSGQNHAPDCCLRPHHAP